jgi:protein-disulfide isomerase
MNRRIFLTGLTTLAAFLGSFAMAACLLASPASAQNPVDDAMVDDPAAPVAGNPKGDVTIVEFSDYNCPYCKQSSAELEKLMQEDKGIRLVYKDWPILTQASLFGARMALAAKYQGKYDAVHAALMNIPGPRIPQDRMLAAIRGAGVDMERLEADLKQHAQDIADLLKRNSEQAEALGIEGTPAFLIGPFLVPSAVDYEGFKQAVAQARAQTNG